MPEADADQDGIGINIEGKAALNWCSTRRKQQRPMAEGLQRA